jgi:uncharacterized phiE125 gp8 family phage protein
MLRVVTPAATSDLTVLATLKAELQITDATSEAYLSDLIRQASDAIARFCNRVFARQGYEETIRLSRPLDALVLSRVPVAAITAVTEDGAALAEGADFEVESESGLLHRLRSDCRVRWCARKVVVTYEAGYELLGGLPYDVERACLDTCKAWWHARGRDPMLRSESDQSIGSVSYIASTDTGFLPLQVQSALKDGGHILVVVA